MRIKTTQKLNGKNEKKKKRVKTIQGVPKVGSRVTNHEQNFLFQSNKIITSFFLRQRCARAFQVSILRFTGSSVKVLLRSKFLKCQVCHKNAFFSAYQKWLYMFRSLKWSLASSKWKYWAWKCRFFASAITNLCSSEPTVWSCGLIIQSYCSLTCDVIFWTRREKQTRTVRKQRAILKASLVFARVWNCKGGNYRLRWLCRTSTDEIG